jgi:PAS domain S-box-containing protein
LLTSLTSPHIYRALLDSMTEGVSLSDEDGTIVYTNPAEDTLFGYERGELIGRHVSVQNAYPEDENQRRVADVIEHLKAHGHWDGEWLNRRKDGGSFVTSSRITAVEIDGRPHWLCVQRDISVEREAQQRLHDSEARLRLALGASRMAMFDHDLETDELRHSEELNTLFGIAPGCTMRMADVRARYAPGELERLRSLREEALARGENFLESEFWILDEAGTRRCFLLRAETRTDPDSVAIGTTGIVLDVTDRKEAESKLIESERRFRALVDAVPSFVWFADAQGELEYLNDRWYEFTGQSPEEALPSGWAATLHPDDAERTAQEWAEARSSGTSYRNECRYRRKDGAYRWHVAYAEPVRDESGTILRWFGTSTDVHEQKEAAERLRESQAELRAIYDAVPVGIVIGEAPSGRIAGGNAEVERVFGHPILPSEDIEGYRDWVSFHPDGRQVEAHEYPLSRALKGEAERPQLEVLYRRGDGRDAWLRLVASPIRDEAGNITRAVVAALDIDQERRAQQALVTLNERLETEVQQRTAERDRMWRLSTDLMLVSAFDGTIEAVNPAWAQLLGWQTDELIGRSFMTLVHPDDADATLAEMASLERGVTTFRFTNRYRGSDEQYRWISWTAVPGDGRIHAVGRDITTERLAAAELEQAQEALRQSQKLEAMGQLTGGVAHDFNNLLSPIIGGLDLLQRRNFGDDRARRTISGALASAERAKTLVQRLLAFARRQPLQPTAVDVGATIKGMAGLLASTLGPRIDLRIDVAQPLPPAHADANQLEMALLNVTLNARDAMPDGGELHISATGEDVPAAASDLVAGRYLRIVVRDTGMGMDAETLGRCIEPFFSTKGVGQGTGLGLSMVHGLAAQLSGALRIESSPGRGTTIELWLPASDAIADQDEPEKRIEPTNAAGRALVVDDEELVRLSTAEMLQELGYKTIEAVSADDALRVLSEAPVDLLVTDHLMPGMTGTELANMVRDRFPKTKVLIVSGYAEAAALSPGYTRLTKPFRQSELANALAD